MSHVLFYVGLHQPSDGQHFDRACISWRRLLSRRKPLCCGEVLIDSGAFTEVVKHGGYRCTVAEYAAELRRLHADGVATIIGAVAQDYMCEPIALESTGLSIVEHQRLTIERCDALVAEDLPFPILPVLQGYAPEDYVHHIEMYGDRLRPGMWVGVGSVCKRDGDPARIVEVLSAIHAVRPDLRLHGFGIKLTALAHPGVRSLLYSADSMAWSDAARKQGRNANCWTEAAGYRDAVLAAIARPASPWQIPLPLCARVPA